jgi:hypothetical protein
MVWMIHNMNVLKVDLSLRKKRDLAALNGGKELAYKLIF